MKSEDIEKNRNVTKHIAQSYSELFVFITIFSECYVEKKILVTYKGDGIKI